MPAVSCSCCYPLVTRQLPTYLYAQLAFFIFTPHCSGNWNGFCLSPRPLCIQLCMMRRQRFVLVQEFPQGDRALRWLFGIWIQVHQMSELRLWICITQLRQTGPSAPGHCRLFISALASAIWRIMGCAPSTTVGPGTKDKPGVLRWKRWHRVPPKVRSSRRFSAWESCLSQLLNFSRKRRIDHKLVIKLSEAHKSKQKIPEGI
jgi:hypothetical protein